MAEEKLDKKTMIDISRISLNFGGTVALNDISLEIRDNELLALIGPNGSGKTSMLNSITGYYRPQKGSIYLNGNDLVGLKTSPRSCYGCFQKLPESRVVYRHVGYRQSHGSQAQQDEGGGL